MKKNVAGQAIGAQLVNSSDGSAVTSGTTTVYRTGDNGTQTSIGTATHKGQGYWSIALSQANTNFDHAAFTFVNTNAVSATVQVFTSFPQSRDLSSDVTAILADTDELQGNQGDWATATGFSTFNPATDTVANVTDVANITSTVVANFVQCKGTPLTNDQRDTFLTFISEVGSTTSITDLATQASVDTVDGNVDAIKAKTDDLTFSVAGVVNANVTRFAGGNTAVNNMFQVFVTDFATNYASNQWDVSSNVPTTTEIEAALLNEGDGQQLIETIMTKINTDLDVPALELAAIASAVRTELATELGRIDTTVSSRLATSGYTSPANSDILAIKNKTDDLTFGKANEVDVNIKSVNDVTVNGTGANGDEWGP
jgi:hypothetical protein